VTIAVNGSRRPAAVCPRRAPGAPIPARSRVSSRASMSSTRSTAPARPPVPTSTRPSVA
jgi:hypothetical protein